VGGTEVVRRRRVYSLRFLSSDGSELRALSSNLEGDARRELRFPDVEWGASLGRLWAWPRNPEGNSGLTSWAQR
jgi:hypothetical protein